MFYENDCILNEALIFDSHSHYDDSKFDGIRAELLETMHNNGVAKIITCGCDVQSSKAALSLAEKYDFIYAAVGIHPGNLDNGTNLEEIKELAKHPKCVAIGEIGLDYYWQKDNAQLQKQTFIDQLKLASDLSMPVIIHDRDAHEDTLNILEKYKPKGVVHCFSGSVEMARSVLKIGLYIGIGGVVTFKNAKKMPELVSIIPDDRLLIETDCPYLAPEPYRGKLCHSGMIKLTAEKIAKIKNCDISKILKTTYQNANDLFGL